MDGLDRPHSLDSHVISDSVVCVTLSGEWDMQNTPRIIDAVCSAVEANQTGIVLDLRAVSYLDSTALTALLQTQKQAEHSRWSIALVRPRDSGVWRLFELTALTTRFAFFDTRTAALLHVSYAER